MEKLNIKANREAKIVVGGKRVRVNPDGTVGGHFTQSPEQQRKAERRAANKRARKARRRNRV